VLGSGLGALLVGPAGLAELVVEVRQLVAEVPHPVVELGRLLPGVRGVLAGLPRLARRPSGPLLRLGAELLEEPDPLYQSLMLGRVHYASVKDANPTACRAPLSCVDVSGERRPSRAQDMEVTDTADRHRIAESPR
jgi:hypothetical protein